jgi:hypothetical protein
MLRAYKTMFRNASTCSRVRNGKFQKCVTFLALPCLSVRLSACLTRELLNTYVTRFGIYNLPTISNYVKNRAITDTSYGQRHTCVSARISSITCQNIYRRKTIFSYGNVIRPTYHSRKYCGCRDNYVCSRDLQF